VLDYGCQDEDHGIQRAAWKAIDRTLAEMDVFGPDARRFLIPLLDDPDPAIRVMAGAGLLKIMPERAIKVLNDIEQNCLERTRWTAYRVLYSYKEGGWR
jgi:hypothetical protein